MAVPLTPASEAANAARMWLAQLLKAGVPAMRQRLQALLEQLVRVLKSSALYHLVRSGQLVPLLRANGRRLAGALAPLLAQLVAQLPKCKQMLQLVAGKVVSANLVTASTSASASGPARRTMALQLFNSRLEVRFSIGGGAAPTAAPATIAPPTPDADASAPARGAVQPTTMHDLTKYSIPALEGKATPPAEGPAADSIAARHAVDAAY